MTVVFFKILSFHETFFLVEGEEERESKIHTHTHAHTYTSVSIISFLPDRLDQAHA